MKSDWELENAYLGKCVLFELEFICFKCLGIIKLFLLLKGNAKPYLDVKVDKTIVSNLSDDGWDIVTTSDLNRVASYAGKQTSQLANNFLNRVSCIEDYMKSS